MVLVEQRLGVEGVDLRRAAVHEQVDDALGLAGEVRLLGRQRIRRFRMQQVGQGESPEPKARAEQEVAAGTWSRQGT